MATTTLVIVILALIGNFTIVILPIDKAHKALFCGMIGAVFAGCALFVNVQTGQEPVMILEKIRNAPTTEARQLLMERFNVSQAALSIKAEKELKTPLEICGGVFSVFALTLTWVLVAAVRKSNDEQAGQAYKIVQMLSLAAALYLLSLYLGLQLSVIAWTKSKKVIPAGCSSHLVLEKA